MKAIANVQSHATSNPSSISQRATLRGLTGDQSFIEKMRLEFQSRRDYMLGRISRMKNVSCIRPEGAFYVFCDISRTRRTSVQTANDMLEKAGTAVIPGAPFGEDGFIRLSFATGMETIKKGMDRMEEYFAKNG
jgi:aspartate aminotransferase